MLKSLHRLKNSRARPKWMPWWPTSRFLVRLQSNEGTFMEFDVNTLRSLVTVVSFLTFIGIIGWAYSRKNSADFDKAANLPFEQD
ncbi:cbb3-type cytochrome oxidase subunit 3 [Rhodoferax sp.]|uniref:cbb3-type cytochrome oxidase subunit 3 n=1 Tax=Rhodoferax sp. TaxID=50421 RepID=UPI00351CC7FF